MNDQLEILLSAKAKDVRRQEIEELALGSLERRRKILRALQPVRSATNGERLTAFFREWRFLSGSAIGAAAMSVLAVTLLPNFETNTRALTSAERDYAQGLGNAVGEPLQNKSSTSLPLDSTSAYDGLVSSLQKIDPQIEAYLTEKSGGVPLIVQIETRDPLEEMSFDLRALTDLQQRILVVDYSSGARQGSVVVILTEALKRYAKRRYGVDLSDRLRKQKEDVEVAFQYTQK